MKNVNILLFALLLALLAPLAVADDANSDGGASADAAEVLKGEYLWTKRDVSGPVEARFVAAGDGKWDVSFQFTFRDRQHTYTGTATGSLSDGALEGEVMNEDKRRTFTFTGTSSAGTFEGTHAEIRDGETIDTGSIKLKG